MRRMILLLVALIAILAVAGPSAARDDLSPAEYRAVLEAAFATERAAQYDRPDGGPGLFLALGDRFGRINVHFIAGGGERGRVWASRTLDGNIEEVVVADLDNDGVADHLVCRTTRRVYAFDIQDDYRETFESLLDTFRRITAFTVANVDNDPQQEIVVAADDRIQYLDGKSFLREWTSMDSYQVARIRAADVDDDRRVELVLDTGQVVDAGNGRVEWTASSIFGARFELLDLDGDGIPEILTGAAGRPLQIWSGVSRRELRSP